LNCKKKSMDIALVYERKYVNSHWVMLSSV